MVDAYEEGRAAFQNGVKLEKNPYSENTEQRKRWEEGWEEAMMEADLKRPTPCSGERRGPAS